MTRRRAHTPRDGGFTLLEVLVVLALLGLVVGFSVRGLRSLIRSDLRATATQLAGAARYLFDRASTTGRVHRLVFDFDEGRVWAEVTSAERVLLGRGRDDDRKPTEEEGVAAAESAATAAAEAQARAQAAGIDFSRYQPEEFRPRPAEFSDFTDAVLKPVVLRSTVKLAGLYTPRLGEIAREGRAAIYFFPLGMTEAAIVHLSDADGVAFFSLVVHPLAGRVRIMSGVVDPPLDNEVVDDQGSRIEP